MLALRLSPSLRVAVDQWAREQDDRPSRSEAIRRLLDIALRPSNTKDENNGAALVARHIPYVSQNAIRRELGQVRKRLTSFQIRAARSILGWTAQDLARESSVSMRTIRRAELTGGDTNMTAPNDLSVRRALELAGVEFIDQNGGGPGVRLRRPLPKKNLSLIHI